MCVPIWLLQGCRVKCCIILYPQILKRHWTRIGLLLLVWKLLREEEMGKLFFLGRSSASNSHQHVVSSKTQDIEKEWLSTYLCCHRPLLSFCIYASLIPLQMVLANRTMSRAQKTGATPTISKFPSDMYKKKSSTWVLTRQSEVAHMPISQSVTGHGSVPKKGRDEQN